MRKSKKVLIILTIVGLILSLSGVTYAYLRARTVQTNNNTISVLDCLNLSFTKETNDINLINAYSITDFGGRALTPYKFTIKNNCPNAVLANINLESLNVDNVSSDAYLNSYLSDSYIKAMLTEENDDTEVLDLLSNFTVDDKILDNAETSHTLKTVTLVTNESKSFELRLWIDENVTWEQAKNKKYSAKVVISGKLMPDTSLAGMIRVLYPNIESPKTTPGFDAAYNNEALLASTLDDYGTSYYFRGAVTNNYVQFAGKCWRIVRITGNGAIKIILHNDNVNNVSNPCDASNNDTTAAFARYDGETYTSVFNSSCDSNAYVGFMYGTPKSSTYAEEHENKNDSTILTNLKKWYDLSFNDNQKSLLADVIYCGDKSTYQSDTTYNPRGAKTIGTNYGIGTNINYYSGASRFVSASNEHGSAGDGIAPTLICPNDDNGGKLSKYTSEDTVNGNGALKGYKVGLLSADEYAFAGGAFLWYNRSLSMYLLENALGSNWWTMTPCMLQSTNGTTFWANEMRITKNYGSLSNFYVAYNEEGVGIRPVVSLIPTVKISSGTGVASDPFVVSD